MSRPVLTADELVARCICDGLDADDGGHQYRCPVAAWQRRHGVAVTHRTVAAADLARLLDAARRAWARGERPC